MLKNCEHCGKPFNAVRINVKFCSSQCRNQNYKLNYKSPYNEKEGKKMSRIAELNALAREQGLSYGRYVAKLYLEEQKRLEARKRK